MDTKQLRLIAVKNIYTTEIYAIVRNAVDHDWDPIGLTGIVETIEDYEPYVGSLCDLVLSKSSEQAIFETLWKIETNTLGLCGNRKATKMFAKQLYRLSQNYNLP